jgi:hypothetical protein
MTYGDNRPKYQQGEPTFSVSELKDLPPTPHFVVLVEESFSYDDGYGERGQTSTSTHRSLSYTAVMNEEVLKTWILENDKPRYGQPKQYKIFRVSPVTVVKHVDISFEDA